jgi:hypothetical protein
MNDDQLEIAARADASGRLLTLWLAIGGFRAAKYLAKRAFFDRFEKINELFSGELRAGDDALDVQRLRRAAGHVAT